MTNVEHTPGPWTAETNSRELQSASIQSDVDMQTQGFHSGRKIAFIPASLGFDRRDANACLIAAAPELLDALEKMIAFYNFDGLEPDSTPCALAAQVVSKARGCSKI